MVMPSLDFWYEYESTSVGDTNRIEILVEIEECPANGQSEDTRSDRCLDCPVISGLSGMILAVAIFLRFLFFGDHPVEGMPKCWSSRSCG